ncbi:MAG: hypothetical protein R3E50_06845 [Halioglobus sp.]
MKPQRRVATGGRGPLLAALLCSALAGCTVVGPEAIGSGRIAYNEVIARTNNEQMLMVLVHNRYEEQGSMLAVASVTANVSIKSSAGIQAGFGNDSDYRGNLVPFSGGFIYEENPTISYTPVAGERYLRQLTYSLPVAMVAQMARTMTDPRLAFVGLISSVNGIYNPDFIFGEQDDDPRFDRFATIMAELTQAHRLNWVENAEHKGRYSIVIDQSDPDHPALVKELLDLLHLPQLYSDNARIVIPVRLSLDGAQQGVMGISTRSVLDLVEVLCARIEVPPGDQQAGMVADYPPVGRLGRNLAIHFSPEEPAHGYIKVTHRGGWFYIDERDLETKRYFKLLGSLWSLAVASSLADGPAAPLLTVPVSN